MNEPAILAAEPLTARKKKELGCADAAAKIVGYLANGPAPRSEILRRFYSVGLTAGVLDETCRGLLDDGTIAVDRVRSKGRPALVIRLTDEARAALA
jgi:hypothetical protein